MKNSFHNKNLRTLPLQQSADLWMDMFLSLLVPILEFPRRVSAQSAPQSPQVGNPPACPESEKSPNTQLQTLLGLFSDFGVHSLGTLGLRGRRLRDTLSDSFWTLLGFRASKVFRALNCSGCGMESRPIAPGLSLSLSFSLSLSLSLSLYLSLYLSHSRCMASTRPCWKCCFFPLVRLSALESTIHSPQPTFSASYAILSAFRSQKLPSW